MKQNKQRVRYLGLIDIDRKNEELTTIITIY